MIFNIPEYARIYRCGLGKRNNPWVVFPAKSEKSGYSRISLRWRRATPSCTAAQKDVLIGPLYPLKRRYYAKRIEAFSLTRLCHPVVGSGLASIRFGAVQPLAQSRAPTAGARPKRARARARARVRHLLVERLLELCLAVHSAMSASRRHRPIGDKNSLRRNLRHHHPHHFWIEPTDTVSANDKVSWIENVAFDEIKDRSINPRSLRLH